MNRLAVITMLALFAAPAGAAGEVYKCTRADGSVYYSGKQCPAGADTTKLDIPPPPAHEDTNAEPADTRTLDERIAEATDPVVKARLQIQKQECELAKTQLQRYADAPFLIERMKDGSERRLSAEETQAEKDRLRGKIEARCK